MLLTHLLVRFLCRNIWRYLMIQTSVIALHWHKVSEAKFWVYLFISWIQNLSAFDKIHTSIPGNDFIMITTFLCRGKEQYWFISWVTRRSDNNYLENIFHIRTKLSFLQRMCNFCRKKIKKKRKYSLTVESIEVHLHFTGAFKNLSI